MLPFAVRSGPIAVAVGAAAIAVISSNAVLAQVTPHPGMLRYPDVSRTHIVFSYANDLWIVPREGGMASPLASPPGQEQMPRFSADGKTIAFIGNYDGNRDLYTIPIEGGVPERITHHPSGEVLCDWTPGSTGDNARLLFFTSGMAGLARQQQLFTVNVHGGMPEQLPVPYGTMAAINEDGVWLAYTPHTADNRTWKRYRGGMATDIWLFNLKDHTSKKMTDWEGTDTQPMWHGSTVYYLSDQGDEHRLNIWSYDTKSSKREQITRYKDYDVKWPAIGPGASNNSPGEIIFQNASGLYLLDLGKKTAQPVNVTIPGDRPTIREKSVDAAEFIQGAGISSTGKRACVQARGDIWTCPAEEGSPRNLTRTDGVAERDPSWSPDGHWIAYFSDSTGEYELYVMQSDGKGEPRQLTHDANCFRFNPVWSPDSKHIAFTDKTGTAHLCTVESGETKVMDTDPWANQPTIAWSHDSRWIAYDRSSDDSPVTSIWIYNVASGEKKQVTSGYFADSNPVFDRKGDYLYFRSNRRFDPTYGDAGTDTTFIYEGTAVLMAAPLRADMASPYAPKSDEEKWDKEKKEEDADKDKDKDKEKDGKADEAKKDDGGNGDKKDNGKDDKKEDAKPAKDDGVSGTWSGSANTPDGVIEFTLSLTLNADKSVTGSLSSSVFSGSVSGTYDPDSKSLSLSATLPNGAAVTFDLKIDNNSMSGTAHSPDGDEVPVSATRKADDKGAGGKKDDEKDKDKPRKEVTIDFDGFEHRAFILPPVAGQFGRLAVNDSNQLIYGRNAVGAGGPATGIYLFDLKDEKKEEKSVAAGAMNFDISADGKKLMIMRGPKSASIQNAAAGATGKNVVTEGMNVQIKPRDEWRQMFTEAWRLERDFFYVPNMHGVNWPAIKEQYGKMLADCVTRDDVSYVISEMISELNVGHAYYSGGDVEDQPNVNVGLLGVDFALENGAYRITRIVDGGLWDADARGPLMNAAEAAPLEKNEKADKADKKRGIVKEGDYLLAVNGVPMSISADPWAPFIGTVGKVVTLTVSDKPVKDETARDVLVKPAGSEVELRYRAWSEAKRAYVEKKTDGKVGYIHVPDTGQNGQNNLYRGFYGQMNKKALIVDDRWNAGGQIPTRFIELLNRPVTNYWARRDGHDWPWPPDSMQGPKCMLINGLAGSGGDAFPYYFKQAKVGPAIGMRTWGGLVGISGNPGLIDGGNVTVPTFGFYKTNGTWGVEGHGVDPDVEVVDDPALMVDGGDPQLDKAISMMLDAVANTPYVPAKRPAPPEKAGMGMRDEDK